ncbi:TPA: hypothetical protein DDW69_03470 [candidate division CPR2 bacterium]|nr:hypothetical protein [candidate division CPR2 bacterium]
MQSTHFKKQKFSRKAPPLWRRKVAALVFPNVLIYPLLKRINQGFSQKSFELLPKRPTIFPPQRKMP